MGQVFTRQQVAHDYVLDCWVCGIRFSMPQHIKEKRAENGSPFWCPNGHKLAFGPSEADELRKQLADEKWKRERAQNEADNERKRADRASKKLKRAEKRAAAGLCLFCNRHFTNLERHVHTKHPDEAHKPTGKLP